MSDWPSGWLVHSLTCCLDGWLGWWLFDWLAVGLDGCLTCWLSSWQTEWTDWLDGWLTDDVLSGWLTLWLTDGSVGFLNHWFTWLVHWQTVEKNMFDVMCLSTSRCLYCLCFPWSIRLSVFFSLSLPGKVHDLISMVAVLLWSVLLFSAAQFWYSCYGQRLNFSECTLVFCNLWGHCIVKAYLNINHKHTPYPNFHLSPIPNHNPKTRSY